MGIQKDKLIYDGTTPADGDSVAAFLHGSGGKLTSTNVGGKEALDVNVANAIEVSIDKANDSIVAWQGGTWEVSFAAGSTTAVTATDLDIRDLTDASDSVQASQKGTWSVAAKDCAETFLNTLVAVSTTAAMVASALTGRRRILVQNQGNKAIFVGPSGVSNTGASTGLKVSAGANIEIPLGAGAALHAIAESGTQNCVIMELA
jgi:hypothetical protein